MDARRSPGAQADPGLAPLVLLTGATRGIGRAAAALLGAQGARLLIVARHRARGEEVVASLPGTAELHVADLSSLEDVRSLAARVSAAHEHIDVLINNAGIVKRRRELTPEGHEVTWAVNHLAPFLLAGLLAPRLSGGGRVVNVNSEGHRAALFSPRPVTVDFENLSGERGYSAFGAYSQAKLANLLTTYVSARRLGTVSVNAIHPGVINTGITREMRGLRLAHRAIGRPAAEGARAVARLATEESPRTTGSYFDGNRTAQSSAASHDRALQRAVWDLSCELTGLPRELSVGQPAA
jgi:NAD(P)-dependent dehydrogenase (short-subunit alcohol dehydrogenase family)